MKSKLYLAKLVRKHHEAVPRDPPIAAVKTELRKAFSKEQLTTTLRKRLFARRQRDELLQQLQQLEQALLTARGEHHERTGLLLARLAKIKKKVEEKI